MLQRVTTALAAQSQKQVRHPGLRVLCCDSSIASKKPRARISPEHASRTASSFDAMPQHEPNLDLAFQLQNSFQWAARGAWAAAAPDGEATNRVWGWFSQLPRPSAQIFWQFRRKRGPRTWRHVVDILHVPPSFFGDSQRWPTSGHEKKTYSCVMLWLPLSLHRAATLWIVQDCSVDTLIWARRMELLRSLVSIQNRLLYNVLGVIDGDTLWQLNIAVENRHF